MLTEQQTAELEVYKPYREQLAKFKEENATLHFDYESKQGDKDARSHVYAMRQGKAAVDKARKAAKEESLKVGRQIDAEAKAIVAEIDEMISVHQERIDEVASREAIRIQALEERVQALDFQNFPQETEPEGIEKLLNVIRTVEIDDTFQEYEEQARTVQQASIDGLEMHLEKAKQRKADEAELAELRAEQAKRQQAERDEQIRKDAEAKAKRESEQRERESAERAEQAEKAKAAADRQAKKDAKAAAAREAELAAEAKRLQDEADERDRKMQEAQDAIAELSDAISGCENMVTLTRKTAEILLEALTGSPTTERG